MDSISDHLSGGRSTWRRLYQRLAIGIGFELALIVLAVADGKKTGPLPELERDPIGVLAVELKLDAALLIGLGIGELVLAPDFDRKVLGEFELFLLGILPLEFEIDLQRWPT